jgi:hypothetical protein
MSRKLFIKIILTMLIVTMMTPTQAIFGMTDQAPVAQQVEDLASLTPEELK